MSKDKTIIPINWVYPILFFSASVLFFYLLYKDGEISGINEARNAGAPYAFFVVGIFSLRSYSLNSDGISVCIASVPRQTILWENVVEARIVPDDKSFCILFILKSCPTPNYANHETYNCMFARKHPDHVLILENAKKVLPIVEQYYPGEIKGKELLLQNKKP